MNMSQQMNAMAREEAMESARKKGYNLNSKDEAKKAFAEAYVESFAASFAKSYVEATARCEAIITDPEARANPELALYLATDTKISVEGAIATIKAANKRAAVPPRPLNMARANTLYGGNDVAGRLAMLDRVSPIEQMKQAGINAVDFYKKAQGKGPEPKQGE